MPIEQPSSGVHVITLADDPAFSAELARALQLSPATHVLLDFAAVGYVNSKNLSSLLQLRQHLHSRDKRMQLCGVADRVWGLFLATGLNQLFDVSKTRESAIVSLQNSK